MAKPVIWTVDDDPDVLRAVERDLRRHYVDRCKVISADWGVSALEAMKQLKLRNEPVALFLVDQRMPRMPVVVFPDGSFLSKPPAPEIARRLGLKTKAEFPFYDLVVVGAGPSGLAAAVYGAADGLHTLLIEREAPGGQAGRSSRIENYLGFPVGLSGNDLA